MKKTEQSSSISSSKQTANRATSHIKKADRVRTATIKKVLKEHPNWICFNKRKIKTVDLAPWKGQFKYHKSSDGSDVDTPDEAKLRISYARVKTPRAKDFLNLYKDVQTNQYYTQSFIKTGTNAALQSEVKLINADKNPCGFMFLVVARLNESNASQSVRPTKVRVLLAPFIGSGTATNHNWAVDPEKDAVLISGEMYFKDNQFFFANTKSHHFNNSGTNQFHLPDNLLQRKVFAALFKDNNIAFDQNKFFQCTAIDEYLWAYYISIGFYDQLSGIELQRLTARILHDPTLLPALQNSGIHSIEEVAKVTDTHDFIERILKPRLALIETSKKESEIKEIWDARKKEKDNFHTVKGHLLNQQFNKINTKQFKEILSRIKNPELLKTLSEFNIHELADVDDLYDDQRHELLKRLSTKIDDLYDDLLIDKSKYYFESIRTPADIGKASEAKEVKASVQGNKLILEVPGELTEKLASIIIKNESQTSTEKTIVLHKEKTSPEKPLNPRGGSPLQFIRPRFRSKSVTETTGFFPVIRKSPSLPTTPGTSPSNSLPTTPPLSPSPSPIHSTETSPVKSNSTGNLSSSSSRNDSDTDTLFMELHRYN